MSDKKPLVGSVFERKPGSSMVSPSSPKSNESATGFPRAVHRSKSHFARKRGTQQQSVIPSHAAIPPVVQRAPRTQNQEGSDADDWRVRMSEENERLVAAMTEEEREQERSQIGEKFGKNIGDVLRKARMAREAHGKTVASLEGDGTLSGSYEVKLPYSQISNAFKTVHTALTGTLFQSSCTLS
jgi:RNA polymerase II-associated protein 1